MQLDPVKQELLESDDDFRNLFEEHKQCKERLEALRHKSLLAEDDEMEIKRIKLHKLSLKDRMEVLARERMQAVA